MIDGSRSDAVHLKVWDRDSGEVFSPRGTDIGVNFISEPNHHLWVVLSIVANPPSLVKPFAERPTKAHGCSPIGQNGRMFAKVWRRLQFISLHFGWCTRSLPLPETSAECPCLSEGMQSASGEAGYSTEGLNIPGTADICHAATSCSGGLLHFCPRRCRLRSLVSESCFPPVCKAERYRRPRIREHFGALRSGQATLAEGTLRGRLRAEAPAVGRESCHLPRPARR